MVTVTCDFPAEFCSFLLFFFLCVDSQIIQIFMQNLICYSSILKPAFTFTLCFICTQFVSTNNLYFQAHTDLSNNCMLEI